VKTPELENPSGTGKSVGLSVVKNAVANVARGTAAALIALAVPPFLTRALPPEKYGAWALVLQLSAYVGYLEFGIQTAVGRFVARGNERSDFRQRDRIVNTAWAALSAAGLLAITLIAALLVVLPRLFRQMPATLYPDVRIAVALVGGSLAIGLPASVFSGIFVGLQRYDVLAEIVVGSRVVGAIAMVMVARHGGSIPSMALSVAAANLASYALQWLLSRRYAPDIQLSPRLVSRQAGRELAGYCVSLTVWSFAMLLVSGLDLTLVGAFDFDKMAFYAVAASLVTFVAGLQNAVFSVMTPSTAVLHARGASTELGRMVIDGTRYGMLLLLVTGLPLFLAAKPILQVWVGPLYAERSAILLRLLVVANVLRLSATPYIATLIGTGQQRLVVVTPLLEGFTNLSVSVLAGYYFGAVGVALGTLVGAVVGVCGIFFYNIPRTTEVRFNMREYMLDSLLKPVLCIFPFGVALFLQQSIVDLQGLLRMVMVLSGGTATLYCLWRWGLVSADRNRLRALSRLSSF
jgi:O-antigen/teichoic acid export membrane protein